MVPATLLWKYLRGLLHRLADVLVGGEVHDSRRRRTRGRRGDELLVGDVADHERGVDHGLGVAELERVEHHHVAPAARERSNGVRADVAGATGDESCSTCNSTRPGVNEVGHAGGERE